MSVTPIGYVLLLIGPLLMFWRPRWLYFLTVFFLPFTATGVANVGEGLDASAVQVSMFLGTLLIARCLWNFLREGSFPIWRSDAKSLMWLGLFILSTAISLVMPIWINGHVRIPSPHLLDLSTTPLYLNSHNITGVLYMVYGFLFAYLIAVFNHTITTLRSTITAFMAGSAFSAVWALVELGCKITGLPYPAVLFNTGTGLSTMGYKEQLGEHLYRLSSVGVEPSIFAQSLLVAVAMYLPFVFGRLTLFGKKQDRVLFCFLFTVLCLTTASTAYLGIGFTVVLLFVLLTIRGLLSVKHLFHAIAGLTITGLLYLFVPVVQRVADEVLISKSGGYSAIERLMTIHNTWEMFVRYPVLGIGWGSITSHDLVVNILGNGGIAAAVPFVIAVAFTFRALYRSISRRRRLARVSDLMHMDFAMYVALAVTLFTSLLSGFLNVFSFFWFTWGLAIAIGGMDSLAQIKSVREVAVAKRALA